MTLTFDFLTSKFVTGVTRHAGNLFKIFGVLKYVVDSRAGMGQTSKCSALQPVIRSSIDCTSCIADFVLAVASADFRYNVIPCDKVCFLKMAVSFGSLATRFNGLCSS